ncbi:MAG: MBL fold metallo-hydrolase [Gemmatimonadetes bacterium]|nr:MBL fold metallo-hydrolase [Gemmatimonadota bacterium]
MTLVETFKVGGLVCHVIDAGTQRLDGGAMFGVVPKPLWEKKIPADDQNRISLGLNCLLVEHPDGLVLIDTGVGNKYDEKFGEIYMIENTGKVGPTRLEDALAELGFTSGDVAVVINTHLHFDHAGGNTLVTVRGDNESLPSFPNATYVVQEGELEFAEKTNERTAASYLRSNFDPVSQAGMWNTVSGESEIRPGITLVPTPGHVPYHQSVVISDGGETACFLGDLVPTTAHLRLPWIMGYDLEPLRTLESKRDLLGRAEAEGWILVFEHDPERSVGRVALDGKAYVVASLDIN